VPLAQPQGPLLGAAKAPLTRRDVLIDDTAAFQSEPGVGRSPGEAGRAKGKLRARSGEAYAEGSGAGTGKHHRVREHADQRVAIEEDAHRRRSEDGHRPSFSMKANEFRARPMNRHAICGVAHARNADQCEGTGNSAHQQQFDNREAVSHNVNNVHAPPRTSGTHFMHAGAVLCTHGLLGRSNRCHTVLGPCPPHDMTQNTLGPAIRPSQLGEGEGGWMHLPFLEHAESGDPGAGERSIAAFLVLRIADVFHLSPEAPAIPPHQIQAAKLYVESLFPRTKEVEHLQRILAAAGDGHDPLRKVTMAMFAYADWLHEEYRLSETLDVLDTTCAVGRTAGRADTETGVLLRRGRTLRLAGYFDESITAYQRAAALATQGRDARSERLSRIGRATTLQQLGNLPAAELLLEGVVADAIAADDRDARARATHDLACNDLMQGRADRAAIRAFCAYQLYEDPERRTFALSDAGIALQELGYDAAARDAFRLALTESPSTGMQVRAGLELLALEAKAGDRKAFDRRRDLLQVMAGDMPPRVAVDFDIKLGQGYARFEELPLAVEHLERAVARAETHRLNELLFRAERVLTTLDRQAARSQPRIDWATEFPDVAVVAGTLRKLLVE